MRPILRTPLSRINVDPVNVDTCSTLDGMTRYVGATEAARLLGIQKTTLYAYVSRGLIGRRVAVDGRTSLYAVDDVDALASRVRKREAEPRPSLDVQIVTGVTTLDETGVRYLGRDVATLSRAHTYEQVAELLWTGEIGTEPTWGPPAPDDLTTAVAVTAAVGRAGVPALIAVASALAVRHPADPPPAAARRLIGVAPAVLHRQPVEAIPWDAGIGARLAAAWQADPPPELARTLDRALVLLADHELATSTLAVRVAGSTRPGPYLAYAAGLAALHGPYHGGAARAVHELLVECEREGAAPVVMRRLQAHERLPGFGHKIYVGDDPRLGPLFELVRSLPDPHGRIDVVDDLLVETGVRMTKRPNVDIGLGALTFVADLPEDIEPFAVARLAGFAAHLREEMEERPVRYRGLARAKP
jgi:citrate synthase